MLLASLANPYVLAGISICLFYLAPFLRLKNLHDIPYPFPAAFSSLWMLYQCRKGRRSLAVHEAHKKFGKFVRIQPNHISIADVEAIKVIYGHGHGFLKADYYDAFIAIKPSIFNTRDRMEHARKRKLISHAFSAKSVGQFEPFIHENIHLFLKQWTQISDIRKDPKSGYAAVDALDWFNYLAFDIVSHLAFGSPLGMLMKGEDIAPSRSSMDAPLSYVPTVKVANDRGNYSVAMACFPALAPFAKYLPIPFIQEGIRKVDQFSGIVIALVAEKLRSQTTTENSPKDFTSLLLEGRDETGSKLSLDEVLSDALSQFIAGSDTTANTACAILYWVLKTPGVLDELQRAIDDVVPVDVEIPPYSMAKDIPYLQWVISETLRIHSTSSLGLHRVLPSTSPPITISGHIFYPGTVLSVPTYTIHHSPEIWGPDVEEFVPLRWDPARLTPLQKAAFIPFSIGPRGCVGRNVAEAELTCITAAVFKNFDIQLEQDYPMQVFEGFLQKPLGLQVGVKRRQRGAN